MSIFHFQIYGITIAPTWYGLMYILGFIVSYLFLRKYFQWKNAEDIDILLWYVFFGVVLGGRLGYIFLYDFSYFLNHPLDILQIWKGGMSFHGGFLGVLLAIWLFGKKHGYSFWGISDHLAVIIPAALGFGRIGNWINQELPGFFPYSGPFPMVIDGVPHFPNPLFEFLGEGVLLLTVSMFLFHTTKWKNTPGIFSGIFLIGYGIFRLLAECFRLPDAHIGYLFHTEFITLGMLYTLPILFSGIILLLYIPRTK